jgi:NAD(P)-dependent dehydrogenase (short-subunit alcohol dehydrogenase family)
MSPVAIVTASDSGIGQESAKELAENGFDIGITYRTDEAGEQETLEAVRAAGRTGEVRRLDLADLPGAAAVIDDLADSLGSIEVLVNNAGTGDPTGEFLGLSYEEWRQVIDTNLSGAFLCAQRAARRMVDAGNGGRIINITSVYEHVPAHRCLRVLRVEGRPRAPDQGNGDGAGGVRHFGQRGRTW